MSLQLPPRMLDTYKLPQIMLDDEACTGRDVPSIFHRQLESVGGLPDKHKLAVSPQLETLNPEPRSPNMSSGGGMSGGCELVERLPDEHKLAGLHDASCSSSH